MKGKNFFMDTAFIRFSYQIILKKYSIYLAISLYLLLILAYTILVPIWAKMGPIELFSFPTSSMFLMFGIALVSIFIAVEVFRTSIDDGTELLTVSKPLSRLQIVMGKLLIFLSYIFVISFVSLIISSFMFLHNMGTTKDNLIILGGIFIATIINGILFGSISIFISLYKKKVISMIITLSITFLLMVYSMLSSFIVKSPIKIMQEENKTMIPSSYINIENVDNSQDNINIIQGVSLPIQNIFSNNESNDNKPSTPSQLWSEYSKRSKFDISAYFDIGYQLSSIYTLNTPSENVVDAVRAMSVYNNGLDLKFLDFNLIDDFGHRIKIGIVDNDILNNSNSHNNLESKLDQNIPHLNMVLQPTSSRIISSIVYPGYSKSYQSVDINLIRDIANKSNRLEKNDNFKEKFWNLKIPKSDSNQKHEKNEWRIADEINLAVDESRKKPETALNIDDLGKMFLDIYWNNVAKELSKKGKKIHLQDIKKFIDDMDSYLYQWYKSSDKNYDGNPNNDEITFFDLYDIEKDIDQNMLISDVIKTIKNDINNSGAFGNNESANNFSKTYLNNILKNFEIIFQSIDKSTITPTTTFGDLVSKLKSKNEVLYKKLIKRANNNRNMYRVLLSLLGIKLSSYLDIGNISPLKQIPKILSPRSTTFYIGQKTDLLNYRPSFYISSVDFINSFQLVSTASPLNTPALIITWSILALLILVTTMFLYFKRDFV